MALFRFNFGDDADKSIFESGSNTDFHLYTRSTGTARTVFAGIRVTGNSYLGNAAGDTTTVCGNLVVTGNTTTINSTTLQVDDKNIELGTVDTPTDTTADGGGITLKGATDKTILWTNSTDSWHFNQGICLTSGRLHIGVANDASLSAGSGSLQIGATSGSNLLLDNNEVLARNNGATSALYINHDGNHVGFSANTVTANAGVLTSTVCLSTPVICGGTCICSPYFKSSECFLATTYGTGLKSAGGCFWVVPIRGKLVR